MLERYLTYSSRFDAATLLLTAQVECPLRRMAASPEQLELPGYCRRRALIPAGTRSSNSNGVCGPHEAGMFVAI